MAQLGYICSVCGAVDYSGTGIIVHEYTPVEITTFGSIQREYIQDVKRRYVCLGCKQPIAAGDVIRWANSEPLPKPAPVPEALPLGRRRIKL